MPLETQFPHLLKGTGYASWPDLPKCPNGVQLKFNKQTGTSRQRGKAVSLSHAHVRQGRLRSSHFQEMGTQRSEVLCLRSHSQAPGRLRKDSESLTLSESLASTAPGCHPAQRKILGIKTVHRYRV